jgi:hypothetical protein
MNIGLCPHCNALIPVEDSYCMTCEALKEIAALRARTLELEADLARKTLALEDIGKDATDDELPFDLERAHESPEEEARLWMKLAIKRRNLARAALADTPANPLLDELKVLRALIANAADQLDGIKYELSASVYTLEDDEFETVFHVRDILQCALKKGRG